MADKEIFYFVSSARALSRKKNKKILHFCIAKSPPVCYTTVRNSGHGAPAQNTKGVKFMNKEVDLVRKFDGVYAYPRTAFDGYSYTGEPLQKFDDHYLAVDWALDSGSSARIATFVRPCPDNFVKDLERKCNDLFADMSSAMRDCNASFRSDGRYRRSADWKNQPVAFTYQYSRLDVPAGHSDDSSYLYALEIFRTLNHYSDALYELGFTLTVDENGIHTIFGNFGEWRYCPVDD